MPTQQHPPTQAARCPTCGCWRVETWADYEQTPDDTTGPACDHTAIGRWLNAEAGAWPGGPLRTQGGAKRG